MGKRVGAAWVLVLLLAPAVPATAQVSKQQRIRTAGLNTGAAVGLGVAALQAVLQFGFENNLSPTQDIVAFTPTAMACVATSILSTLGLFELFQSVPMHPLLGVLTGSGAGFVEGALIGGATFGMFFGLATAVNPSFTSEPSWWRATAQGALGGAIFGGFAGLVPGAVAGLVLSLIVRR
jgi:hypothetical protein